MLLAEKFILLHIDEKKSKIPYLGTYVGCKNYALSIATLVLMELYLKKKITFETAGKNTFVRVINDSTTGDRFLDESLAMIRDYKKKKTLKKVLLYLGHTNSIKKIRRLFNKLFERLDQQGIIRLEKKFTQKSLNPFFSGRQVLIKPEVKRSILNEILDVINNNKDPTESTVLLITIINATEDFIIFPKESIELVKSRFKEFCKKDFSVFGKVIEEISNIIQFQLAMRVALVKTFT